jgi:hypothetical protein
METNSDYPQSWRWEDDGLTADGAYVRMDSGPSEYGRKPILVLRIDGAERGVWVNTDTLKNKLVDELDRRDQRDFTPGERIIVTRAAEKKLSGNGREYWPFITKFPDAPNSDALALLGGGGGGSGDDVVVDDSSAAVELEAHAVLGGQTDDIPF